MKMPLTFLFGWALLASSALAAQGPISGIAADSQGYTTCAWNSTDVQCWGTVNQRFRGFSGVRQVSVGGNGICVLTSQGVNCPIQKNTQDMASVLTLLKHPRAILVGYNNTVVVDDLGVHSWGNPFDAKPPAGLSPIDVLSTGVAPCFSQPKGVTCFGSRDRYSLIPHEFSNPRAISTNQYNTCFVDDFGVLCWGSFTGLGATMPRTLKKPRTVTLSYWNACVLDDTGVVCWGSDNYGLDKPPTGLVNPRMLASARDHVCVLDDDGVWCWGRNADGSTQVPPDLLDPAG